MCNGMVRWFDFSKFGTLLNTLVFKTKEESDRLPGCGLEIDKDTAELFIEGGYYVREYTNEDKNRTDYFLMATGTSEPNLSSSHNFPWPIKQLGPLINEEV